MKIGDKVTATSDKSTFAKDMFYTGTFEGYTATGKARVKGKSGIRCYSPVNVKIDNVKSEETYTENVNVTINKEGFSDLARAVKFIKEVKKTIAPKLNLHIALLTNRESRDFFRKRQRVDNLYLVKDDIIRFFK